MGVLYQNSILFTNDTLASNSYQWFDCTSGTNIQGAAQSWFKPTTPGVYSLKVTNAINCLNKSSCVDLNFLDIANPSFSQGLPTVFPNPCNEVCTVKLPQNEAYCKIQIMHLSGAVIFSKSYNNIDNIPILMDVPAGMYILSVETLSGKSNHKVIKQ